MTNAQEFLENLKDINLEEGEIVVLSDVAALFISTDLSLAKKIPKELQEHYPDKTVETQTAYELLEMRLYTSFESNGDVCEQIKGTPMSPQISGFLLKPHSKP